MHRLHRGGIFVYALFSTPISLAGRVVVNAVSSKVKGSSVGSSTTTNFSHRAAAASFVGSIHHATHSALSSPSTTTRSYHLFAKGQEKSDGRGAATERKSSSAINIKKKKKKKKGTNKRKMSSSTAKKGKKKTATAKRGASASASASAAKKKKKDDDAFPAVPHAPDCLITSEFERTRSKLLTPDVSIPREKESVGDEEEPCIVYWMMRDVRTVDNWALLFARSLAVQKEVPLRVAYALPPPPPPSEEAAEGEDEDENEDGRPPSPADMPLTVRHGTFLLDGLKVVADELASAKVPFDVLCPASRSTVGGTMHAYCTSSAAAALAVVCDMSPLRYPRQWTEEQAAPLLEAAGIPLYQVDAHNIVPVWMASPKREVGARTLRPKIHKVFSDYCTTFPKFGGNDHLSDEEVPVKNDHDWDRYEEYLNLDGSIEHLATMKAGHVAAMKRFGNFCTSKQFGLKNFDTLRNDPNHSSVCSNLSPWINFGQVSFQRLSLEVRALKKHPNGTAAYIEEGVVRRELSDNFVYYTPDGYDNLDGAAGWARDSLELHSSDEREHLYGWKELEAGETHDDLWNAAQLQLVGEGGMHGFMRMYWAKKILEWTASPAYALATAQYFNDRYAYDGNDPNGFVGVGWSIMGIHDMGWKERPVFGKIRFMNYAGCKRKFKVAQFVARYEGAAENAARASGVEGGEGKLSGKKRKA